MSVRSFFLKKESTNYTLNDNDIQKLYDISPIKYVFPKTTLLYSTDNDQHPDLGTDGLIPYSQATELIDEFVSSGLYTMQGIPHSDFKNCIDPEAILNFSTEGLGEDSYQTINNVTIKVETIMMIQNYLNHIQAILYEL